MPASHSSQISDNPTRAARPLGLIFAVIALGLFTLGLLATGGVSLVGIFFGSQHASATSGPPPPPELIKAVLAGTAIFMLLLAAWSIATMVGLLRLRNWARYSILVIGGLLAFFGITSAGATALLPAMVAASGQQAAVPAGVMQGILLFVVLFYIAIASVGVWWLVYFNLRTVKSCFLPHYANPYPNPYASAYPSYTTAESLATPGGLAPPPPPAQHLPLGRFANVPTSIKVIACLFFVAAFSCLLCTLLPFPAFLAGFFVSGLPGHLVYLVYAVFMGLIGFGLFRLDNRARLGVYFLVLIAVVNGIVMITPWGHARFVLYNATLQRQMGLPPSPVPFDPTGGPILVVGLIFGLVFYGLILYLIERHRNLFTTPGSAL